MHVKVKNIKHNPHLKFTELKIHTNPGTAQSELLNVRFSGMHIAKQSTGIQVETLFQSHYKLEP